MWSAHLDCIADCGHLWVISLLQDVRPLTGDGDAGATVPIPLPFHVVSHRLGAQLRKAETKRSYEMEQLETAASTIDRLRRERETIKRAAKAQKRRAEKAEAKVRQLEIQIACFKVRCINANSYYDGRLSGEFALLD